MATEYTYDEDSFSDLHKDAYGFRPSQANYEAWAVADDDGKQAMWDSLLVVLERTIAEEEAHEQRCIEAFELQVTRTMEAGAESREQAIRWLMDASEWGGDRDYFCYLHGLPYNYFNENN